MESTAAKAASLLSNTSLVRRPSWMRPMPVRSISGPMSTSTSAASSFGRSPA